MPPTIFPVQNVNCLVCIAKLLEAMKKDTPAGYSGVGVDIMIRDMKAEPIPDFVKKVMAEVPDSVTKFGYFKNDKIDGDLT